MNQENRLSKDVRECAKRMTGSREWAENLAPSDEMKSHARKLMISAPAFNDLTEAVQHALSKDEWGMVYAQWGDNPQEYRVVFSNFEVPVFAGYRIVVPNTMLDVALEDLTGLDTDTIEEV